MSRIKSFRKSSRRVSRFDRFSSFRDASKTRTPFVGSYRGFGARNKPRNFPSFPRGLIKQSNPLTRRLYSMVSKPVAVADPSICKARSARRNVLFKNGFAGRGKVKFAKWTEKSLVRC